jgi:microcystin-dependent protein
MSLIVPNATDTVGGTKFQALDQAEPDSLDFEILSIAGSGVFSGGVVTSAATATTVNVSAGVVIVGGIPYTLAQSLGFTLPANPADNRFDLVVARLAAGSVTLVGVAGTNSTTNPTYPRSSTVLTAAFDPATNVDLSTDVVLAAVYRSGSNTITTSRILDKRVIRTISVYDQGSGAPAGGYGGQGSLYLDVAEPALYYKIGASTWNKLGNSLASPSMPIGGSIAWPSKAAIPTGFLELNGQALSTTTYASLFAAFGGAGGGGYTYGGSGGTFNLPDWNGKSLRSTTNTANLGTTVGADTVTIALANLPAHAHDMASHTHTLAHTHGIDHGHTGTADAQGNHAHTVSGTTSGESAAHNHYAFNGASDPRIKFVTQLIDGVGPNAVQITPNTGAIVTNNVVTEINITDHTHTWSGTSSTAGSHAHNITVVGMTGSTISQSTATTGAPSTANTSTVGSGSALTVIPLSIYSRWIVRYN